ncbi:MAG: hypothetical protein GVY35_11850 [Bacteroidetes bacterium]|nr:hypothetical protein [Bacteroidota bacterium]
MMLSIHSWRPGAALALGAHSEHRLGDRFGPATRWHAAAGAGAAGAIAGALIPLAGGRLMDGSLTLRCSS